MNIAGRPSGITYVTTGALKEDMEEVASVIDKMEDIVAFMDGIRGGGEELTEDEFRSSVMSRLEKMREEIEELYGGFNFLGENLRRRDLLDGGE